MNPLGIVRAQIIAWQRARQKKRLLNRVSESPKDIARAEWPESLADGNGFYVRCFQYFHTQLPEKFKIHRHYFTEHNRGFGEDAFHVMWFLLFREFKSKNFLEIGVYRGQTLSLASLLQREFDCIGNISGISPFTAAGDSVSKYKRNVDYFDDTLKNFAHFSLPMPDLLKTFSTDDPAQKFIASRKWDCIYIDGNHDYNIARADWEICSRHVQTGGIIVLDDAGLTTAYKPPAFATAGHPGPSRLAREIDRRSFQEILQVGHNRVFQKIA